MSRTFIGTDEHKELFCRQFIDTHDPYDPKKTPWPELSGDALERLRGMPFWSEAISTETEVAKKVEALVPVQTDPLLREAIALQGFEEERHANLLAEMLRHYQLAEPTVSFDPLGPDPYWGFLRTGYGECFDSFFAFGLFSLAREVELFPKPLIDVLEPVVQEEARHILFFVNWVAWERAQQPWYAQPIHAGRCGLAMGAQVWTRIKTAAGLAMGGDDGEEEDDFMLGVQEALDISSSPAKVVATCIRENDARLAPFDDRLLRPKFVPGLARIAAAILGARGGLGVRD